MAGTRTAAFSEAVRAVDGDVTETTAAEATATLDGLVREPAVGTPLPFEGVSYDGTAVDCPPTGADLARARTGVTPGRLGIADYGSVVLKETGQGEELLGLYPELHVVVLPASAVVADMPAAFDELDDDFAGQPTDAVIATGPSATADMGAVVSGVHGPRDVHVVVLEDR